MGDAEKEVEEEILATGKALDAVILKLGHHGSSTSTSEAFLDAVSPTYGIICSGEGNKYGHPHQETTTLLNRKGIVYYDTKEVGTITCLSTGDGITIETER
jgi:competence protein ComEC